MTVLGRVLDWLSNALVVVAGVAIVLMMLHIVGDATMRTVFNSTLPGTNEYVSYYYMVCVVFLPLAYIQRHRGHVIIELFTTGLSPRAIATFDALVFLFGALVMAYFCYAAAWKATAMTRNGEYVLGMILLVTWPARWLVVIGTGLTSLCFALQAVEEALVAGGRRAPRSVPDGPVH